MANPEKPVTNEAEMLLEHLSDTVFPDLAYDCFPVKTEWMHPPAILEMFCGCEIEVLPGDTVWMIYDPDRDEATPVAIDPVTIH